MLAIEKIEPDPAAAKLVGEFMNALTIADEAERLQAILPLVHDSLKTKDKKDLFSNVKQFSYKRAVNMIKLYKNPVELGNVHKGSVSTIGRKSVIKIFATESLRRRGMCENIFYLIESDSVAKI